VLRERCAQEQLHVTAQTPKSHGAAQRKSSDPALEISDVHAELAVNADADDEASDRPTLTPAFDVETFAQSVAADGGEEGVVPSERPTVAPPFDMGDFARETMAVEGLSSPTQIPAEDDPPAPSTVRAPWGAELHTLFSRGDFGAALLAAASLLASDPTCAEARECADACRTNLEAQCVARIGSLQRVPSVTVSRDRLPTLNLDHRAGFLLSLVDGVSSFSLILDIAGMSRLDGLRLLVELLDKRVIAVTGG
jgi:hypothetical protein